MFGIGTWELIVILVLALILLGPQKLPEVARSLGRGLAKLRKSADEVRREMDLEGLKREVLREDDMRDLHQTLDVRGQIRQAVDNLDLPGDKAAPAEPSTPPQLQIPESEGPQPPGPSSGDGSKKP
jgi:Tat protein translocase TatB subunit